MLHSQLQLALRHVQGEASSRYREFDPNVLRYETIVEATIADLQDALKSGQISSVELTAKHLLRIAKYDRRALYLNSTPIINLDVFDEAQASDDARSSGKLRSDLDGIPCTIKDSYKIKGMTVASGSPAFENLIATEDAFTVGRIKAGGGIILGRQKVDIMTNTSPCRKNMSQLFIPGHCVYLVLICLL